MAPFQESKLQSLGVEPEEIGFEAVFFFSIFTPED